MSGTSSTAASAVTASSSPLVVTDSAVEIGADGAPVHRSSTWVRQQALFGVALRSAGTRPTGRTGAPANTTAPVPPPVPVTPPTLFEAPQSVRGQAIVVFALIHRIPLQRQQVNPMIGGASPDLPRLEDGGATVHGWINILKYLSWKHLPAATNTFYPVVNAASFATPTTTAAASPSAFAIDSALESLGDFQATVDFLSHSFLRAATHDGHQGLLPHLGHTFDKDGGILVPQWQQQQPHSTKTHVPIIHHKAAHHHHNHDRDSLQHTTERHLRKLRSFLDKIQSTLAGHNPNLPLDSALEYLRGAETKPTPGLPRPSLAAAPAASSSAVSAEVPFSFLLGTQVPTLADFVVFFNLHQLPLLRAFMPLLTPTSHTALFLFVERMTRWSAPFVHEVTGVAKGAHLLLARHPILQAYVAPQAPQQQQDALGSSDSSSSGTTRISITASPSTAPAPNVSPPPTAPPSRTVPRLTNANSLLLSESTRATASSLAVEDVANLMEYVDQISVRARANTQSEFPTPPASAAASPPSTPAPSALYPTAVPVARKLPPAASTVPDCSSLELSRPLSQRLLEIADSAPIHWRTVSEKSGVKLLAPCLESTGDHPSYQSMAVATFPLSAPVLMAYLWSMDCYKLLDPLQVMDSRELAPHAHSARSKYSYLSLEIKSASTARRDTADAAPAPASTSPPPSIIPAFAAAPPAPPAPATSTAVVRSARFDFLLLNSWTRLLDGSYVLLHQSVDEEEINAPRKWSKGCLRAQVHGGLGVSGWVLRPFYSNAGGPCCQVTLVSYTVFPARVGSWIAGELKERTAATMLALRNRLKLMMGGAPLVQLGGLGVEHQRTHAHTLHLRTSQTVSPSLVNSVSAHGVQTAPHPKVFVK